jgi:hypothetical protein
MSYDISIWSVRNRLTRKEAIATWDELCEDDDATPRCLIASVNVAAFVAELEKTYPQISSYADDDVDSCPWSSDFHPAPAHITLSCSYSRSTEIVQFVLPLAHRHGLAVFDFVTELIYLPPSKVELSDCTLESPWLLQPVTAYPELIPDILDVLPKRNDPYLVIARSDQHYMQTLWSEPGFILEFREGSAQAHFRAANELDSDTVARIIQLYIRNESWRGTTKFEKVPL